MKALSLLTLVLLLFSCESEDLPALPVGHDRLPAVNFNIDNERDTLLITPGGIRIAIPAGTFISEGTVALEVREAISPAAMLMAGLTTVAENGKLLETGGMVYLGFPHGGSIAPGRSVSVKIPTADRKPGMQPFTMVDSGADGLVWRENPAQPISWDTSRVANGRRLWDENACSACHNKNLRDVATGPALGNVHLYRSQEYLRSFTRNSQKLIASGDSLAICVWENWKPSVMNSYEELTDQEIDDIYYFVAAESERQLIGEDEVAFPLSCSTEITVIGDADELEGPPVRYRTRLTTITNIDTVVSEQELQPTSEQILNTLQTQQDMGSLYYIISVYQPGWNNIDSYRNADDPATETLGKRLHVKIKNEPEVGSVSVFVMSLKERVIISMVKTSDGYECGYGPNIRIPKGPALLVGYTLEEEPGFSLQEIEITDDNNWEIELSSSTYEEMERMLENL